MTKDTYWELTPPDSLAATIDACWFFQPDFPEPRWDILVPEGVVDVIFNFGDPYYRHCLANDDPHNEWIPGNIIVGQRTHLFTIRWPRRTRIAGIRLKAESAHCFVPGSMKNTANRTLPLAKTLLRDLDGITQNYDFGNSQKIADRCFERIEHTAGALPDPDSRLSFATRKIRASRGDIDMRALSDEVGISRRTLERWFESKVGVSPKFYARAVRLHYFLYLHRTRSSDTVLNSVYGAQFHDQSHFIREFKSFTGESPASFFESPPEIYEPLVKSLMARFKDA